MSLHSFSYFSLLTGQSRSTATVMLVSWGWLLCCQLILVSSLDLLILHIRSSSFPCSSDRPNERFPNGSIKSSVVKTSLSTSLGVDILWGKVMTGLLQTRFSASKRSFLWRCLGDEHMGHSWPLGRVLSFLHFTTPGQRTEHERYKIRSSRLFEYFMHFES